MKIKSLAFKTDLFFHRFSGVVLEYDDYLVVKTPTNPTYFWGNLLYFKNPPTSESFHLWKKIFDDQFKSMKVDHMTLAWDSPDGSLGHLEDFIKDGFEVEKSTVMSAKAVVSPPKINDLLSIRPIETEAEWAMVIENQVLARDLNFNEIAYRKFTARKIANYRMMIQENLGVWMGAFQGEQLVGDLGLFVENGLARFQTVGTHPEFRRIGVCSTLIYKTCLMAQRDLGAIEFIMVADPLYHAAKIYETIGFKATELQIGMCKYNKEIWAT